MNLIIRQAIIVDPTSPFHLQKVDILVKNGIIEAIDNKLTEETDQIIELLGLHVSQGWVDCFAHVPDPGYEYKETFETASKAAAAGGYTDVLVSPNSNPVVHNKGAVEYLMQASRTLPVNFHAIAAVTKNAEGKELAEMYDMHTSGAVAFSDGLNSIQSSGILIKALEYLKAIDKILIQLPDDRTINPDGLMNEGIMSTQLGLPARAALAEELMVARDIELVRYTGSKIHFTGISTKSSIDLIKHAKMEGLAVTCSITPYHLFFIDEDLHEYDTYLKVNPPLRTVLDRKALIEAVINGCVDCIASHHLPEDNDHKIIEFEYARNGMTGLQTTFSTIRTALPQLSPDVVVTLFSANPRKIFGLPSQSIEVGADASLSLFNLNDSWTPDRSDNLSKSVNSPFFGKSLQGKALGIINKGSVFLNEK